MYRFKFTPPPPMYYCWDSTVAHGENRDCRIRLNLYDRSGEPGSWRVGCEFRFLFLLLNPAWVACSQNWFSLRLGHSKKTPRSSTLQLSIVSLALSQNVCVHKRLDQWNNSRICREMLKHRVPPPTRAWVSHSCSKPLFLKKFKMKRKPQFLRVLLLGGLCWAPLQVELSRGVGASRDGRRVLTRPWRELPPFPERSYGGTPGSFNALAPLTLAQISD